MYGIARAAPAPIVSASIDAELAIFTQYVMELRGLSESTRHVPRRHIGEFLAACFHEQPIEISKIAPADVVRFVTPRTRGLTPCSVKSVGGSLRSYLRFKAISGTPDTALSQHCHELPYGASVDYPMFCHQKRSGDCSAHSIAVTLPACVTTQSRAVFWIWACVVRKSRICAWTISIGVQES